MKTSIKSFVSLCAIYFFASGLAVADPAVIDLDGRCTVYEEIDGELTGKIVDGDDKDFVTGAGVYALSTPSATEIDRLLRDAIRRRSSSVGDAQSASKSISIGLPVMHSGVLSRSHCS
jgi:hypothetical protein